MGVLKLYLNLQRRRAFRQIIRMDMGIEAGLLILFGLFSCFSFVLFLHIANYQYFYLIIVLQFLFSLSSSKHVDFLRFTYNKSDFVKIRLVENMLVSLPFTCMLILSGNFLTAAILAGSAVFLVSVNQKIRTSYAIPTPFYKHPFEFIVGFRISFILIFLCYYLTFIALDYNNFYLGIFVIVALSVLSTIFYIKVEDTYFVWIYAYKAKGFLIRKVKTAITAFIILSLPPILVLLFMKPENILITITFVMGTIALVTAGVLSKYASFPEDISFRDSIILLLSMLFPVLLFFSVPHFYLRARKQLMEFLND
ncbi:MAG: hypothetical protein JXR56_02495 [Candidatus Cloacimonetes bacterium]|nr:hypothetical protein [Candidatus Cloacimonadota bacterium]